MDYSVLDNEHVVGRTKDSGVVKCRQIVSESVRRCGEGKVSLSQARKKHASQATGHHQKSRGP